MNICSKRWISKICIILVTLLTAYLLITAVTRNSATSQTANEVQLSTDILLTSPFVRDQPKLVVLLSYQRSGSTFVGEWFNTNPDVFYNFEPVDSLYTAMYGTPQNTNVPSDITNYPNGSKRILPEEELFAVSKFLLDFLLCDLESLPMESLLSFYFIVSYDHRASMPYTKCIRAAFLFTFRRCECYLERFCGSRFGEAPESNQNECFRRLWLKQENPNASFNVKASFVNHRCCVESLRQKLRSTCQHLFLDSCRNHSIRVMKTVRATMDSMAPLLEILPNFRVIHLVRDPRAVAVSRKQFKGYVRGIYSGNDTNTIKKEAKLFCNTAVRDIKSRLDLEKKYPGKIYALSFEEIITNTTLYLDNVYRFLEATPHERTVTWLSTRGKSNLSNKTSEEIVKQWLDSITFRDNAEIIESCKEFYKLVRFNWTMRHDLASTK